ncbi:DHA2 family efflux MFS transporter permease subunit [Pelobacter seleniigenes]|uniref:DHA2 family efflux MFS transporter permease subunit n=1 Tax=Pelobacter seleniigenes TaxID=407188 RepID=UPI0004A6AB93|nr:DHA2 family efflux MFS transporter permease subunit [Pelobacter seleniigenes]
MTEPAAVSHTDRLFERFGPAYRWYVSGTVMLGTISTVLTATIVNVALPDIMGTFGMGQDVASLLSTGFLAAMTGTMLLNAWMVESFGQRATFISAMSLFLLASIMGGLAPGQELLILSRLLQGAAAGILQPLSMQVIFQVFPPEKRGSAMGIYALGVVLAPAFGPTLGGVMVDGFSWRYVFFLCVPPALLGLLLATLFMPGRAAGARIKPFDWIGFGLMSLFLMSLLNGLSNGQRYGWHSDWIVGLLVLALVSACAFLLWELCHPAPMLNLRLFRSRGFAGACLVALIFGAGNYGTAYLVPLFVQTIQGYTPTRSGLLLMPAGLILGLVFPISGRLADKIPAYLMIMVGLGLFALSSFLLTGVDVQSTFWALAGWIMIGRIGLGTMIPSLNAGALRALPAAWIGQGSGTINFVRQLGGAFGVNLLAVLLERRTQLYVAALTATQDGSGAATRSLLQGVGQLLSKAGLPTSQLRGGELNYLGRMIYAQGNLLSYRDSFMLVAAIFMLALLPALLMRQTLGEQRLK